MSWKIKDYNDIEAGDRFFCFKSTHYVDGHGLIFQEGNIYTSKLDGHITNHSGNERHCFTKNYWTKYLIKIPAPHYSIGKQLQILHDMKKQGYVYNFKTKEIQKIKT